MRCATACAIFTPVAWLPVKNTPSMRCASAAAPTSPSPTRHCMTAAGTPASCSSRVMCCPVSVAYSLGL
jgi:hypothetical protein